jgi:hypothetical protein
MNLEIRLLDKFFLFHRIPQHVKTGDSRAVQVSDLNSKYPSKYFFLSMTLILYGEHHITYSNMQFSTTIFFLHVEWGVVMINDYIHHKSYQLQENELFKSAENARLVNEFLKTDRERRRKRRKLIISSFTK